MPYQERTYRGRVQDGGRTAFRVTVKETDLMIWADHPLESAARESVLRQRGFIEAYIRRNPEFAWTLRPWRSGPFEPAIVREMAEASARTGVGPMAAVAGAVAQHVGTALVPLSSQVIVENGGDIFLKVPGTATVALYAGRSPLSMRVGIRVRSGDSPVCVCTSSGTIGHSLSLGRSDAACVISASGALADAAATAAGNRVRSRGEIEDALRFGRRIPGIEGMVVVAGDRIGAWGNLEVVPIPGKKG